jgi:hypothetical protein
MSVHDQWEETFVRAAPDRQATSTPAFAARSAAT